MSVSLFLSYFCLFAEWLIHPKSTKEISEEETALDSLKHKVKSQVGQMVINSIAVFWTSVDVAFALTCTSKTLLSSRSFRCFSESASYDLWSVTGTAGGGRKEATSDCGETGVWR